MNQEWAEQLSAAVSEETPGEAMSQGKLIQVINDEAQPGDTIVAAAGTLPGDLLKMWDATGNRKCHLEFGYSCMGYELPAGLGVRMTQPEGEVYVFIGDGTYLMNPTGLGDINAGRFKTHRDYIRKSRLSIHQCFADAPRGKEIRQ